MKSLDGKLLMALIEGSCAGTSRHRDTSFHQGPRLIIFLATTSLENT